MAITILLLVGAPLFAVYAWGRTKLDRRVLERPTRHPLFWRLFTGGWLGVYLSEGALPFIYMLSGLLFLVGVVRLVAEVT